MTGPALQVTGLGVHTSTAAPTHLLRDVAFSLERGRSVGLVGRSGAGKSTVGNALLRLLPRGLVLAAGSRIRLGDDDLTALDADAMRRVRGRRIAMVFQEPLLALDPAMRIGRQLTAALDAHGVATGQDAAERAEAMLGRVGIGDPKAAARRYPHELSGGMRQRLLLATALLLEPEVLIADEPTTALDVTLQSQLLDLLDALRNTSGTALLFISHDLDLVAERCDRVLVLEDGRIADDGPPATVTAARRRAATPRSTHAVTPRDPIVSVDDLAVHFDAPAGLRPRPRGIVRAVDGLSLRVAAGECLGIVGESGCGKSTLARAMLGLVPPTRGSVRLRGAELPPRSTRALRAWRGQVQLVPQDAGASLTPERTVASLIAEACEVHGIAQGDAARRRAQALLAEVGLDPALGDRRPGTLSTGERQRAAIARALAPGPAVLIADEPVANVDGETREHLLALLDGLRLHRELALVLISHDLHAVRRLASRISVMYLGHVVEEGPALAVLDAPAMPYTQMLVASMPTGDPKRPRPALRGEFPSPLHPPAGCPFNPRCLHSGRDAGCQVARPALTAIGSGRSVACPKAHATR